ncbi:MAG: CDP-glucose 4,6-dehydratase [Deltaproteobacteria bacterium]|nr:CDP-glucose 4,6-dehydratase [Deltaproteobacteria bacterium]
MVTYRTLLDMYRGKRVLVTGHTGFKGSWLALWLVELEAEVLGYALDPPSDPNHFRVCDLENRIRHIHGDVRDQGHLIEVFRQWRPEIVFHLAAQAIVRASHEDPTLTFQTNVMGTVNLFEAVRATDSIRVVVNVTSDKCYENQEWFWGYRESDRLGGADPYSASKACAEQVTFAYRQSYFDPSRSEGSPATVLSVRAGNVIGGGDWGRDRLVPDCVRALSQGREVVIRNPNAVRPWQHVLEPLGGYLLLAGRALLEGGDLAGAWNFGPWDKGILTVRETVEALIASWGSGTFTVSRPDQAQAPSSPREASLLRLDWSKAQHRLGWHPRFTLPEALDATVHWYKHYYDPRESGTVQEITRRQILDYMEKNER